MGDFLTYDQHYTGRLREGYFTYDDLLNLAVEELTILHQNYTKAQLKDLDFLLDTNFPRFIIDNPHLQLYEKENDELEHMKARTLKPELLFQSQDFELSKKYKEHYVVKTPLQVLFNGTNHPLGAKIAISELAIDTYSSDMTSDLINTPDYESYIKSQLLSTLLNPKENFLYRDINYYDYDGNVAQLNHQEAYNASLKNNTKKIFLPNRNIGLSKTEQILNHPDLNLTHFLKFIDKGTIDHFSGTIYGLNKDTEHQRTNKIMFPLKSKPSKAHSATTLDSILTYRCTLGNELIKEKRATTGDATLWLSKNTFSMVDRIIIAQSPLDCISHYNQNKSTNRNTLYVAYIDQNLSLNQIYNIENIIDYVAKQTPHFNKENLLALESNDKREAFNHLVINYVRITEGHLYKNPDLLDLDYSNAHSHLQIGFPYPKQEALQGFIEALDKNNIKYDPIEFNSPIEVTIRNDIRSITLLNQVISNHYSNNLKNIYKVKTPKTDSFLNDCIKANFKEESKTLKI